MGNTRTSEIIDWCIEQHRKTNHFYNGYIPYEFHLRMVDNVYLKFKHLLSETSKISVRHAIYGHDLIEDARVSYNDVVVVMGSFAADIVYAVTNEKGKTRKERANELYYKGIRETPYAVFVKLCDRIANVQFGKLMGSSMYEKYKKENPEFIKELGYESGNHYIEMFNFLNALFE